MTVLNGPTFIGVPEGDLLGIIGASGYYTASLIAQLVKNPPAMQETLVQFLGWEDLLEKG